MSGKKKRSRWIGALAALLGVVCALILCALFYGTMVYQLAGERRTARRRSRPSRRRRWRWGAAERWKAKAAERVRMGGKAVRRADADVPAGRTARGRRPMTASPAAYIERMKEEGWQAQLVTGFAIGAAGRDLRASAGENAMLCAKDGETVYMIIAQADEQTRCTRSARTPVLE